MDIKNQLTNQVKALLKHTISNSNDNASSGISAFLRKGGLGLLNQTIGTVMPFASRNGFKVLKVEPGYVQCQIPLKINKNHFGTMYAGALFTLAEMPVGVMALLEFDSKFYPLLKEMTVQFVNVAKSAATIEYRLSAEERARIEAEALKNGKCEFTMDGELKDAEGITVAISRGVYQIRTRGETLKKA
ncbi:MAG: PaaI family thioesterase [SAR324 cluster bacterium]|nr:PaaI family thioesterase [SAR324 cluster bacterium]